MDKSECRVGLRVRLRENFYGTGNRSGSVSAGLTLPAGATGRVVRDSNHESVSVDFDRPFQRGHDCGGAARDGHGWNIVPEALDPEGARRPSEAATRRPAVGDRVFLTEEARRKYERPWSIGTLTTDDGSRLPFLVLQEGGEDQLWLCEDEVIPLVEGGAAQPIADSTVASQAPAAQATPKPWPQAEQIASLARGLAERVHLAEAARDEAVRQAEALRAGRTVELAAAREEGRAEARRELLAEVARVKAVKLGTASNGCSGRFSLLETD